MAYIDPGTGSMLFTILIGLVSAGVYALRNAIVKARFVLSGGRGEKATGTRTAFVIFTDSKRYWNVFEPLCDEFEKRGVALSYFTASPDDPALQKPYEHVTCTFIGEGNKAFARMNTLAADVVISSTPSLDVYQWKLSRDVKWYVHVPHAVSDLILYRMFGIDYYDAVLLTGGFQEGQVRALEQLRNLPAKELAVVGCTYMDVLREKRASHAEATRSEGALGGQGCPEAHHDVEGASELAAGKPPVVLLAPSWGPEAILSKYGGTVIDALLDAGFTVVVRPHPQSFTSEADLIEGLMSRYPQGDRLEWNRDNDNFDVLSRADVLVSDFSGVVFDFALVFGRPVIYTEPNIDRGPYDAWWLDDELWTYTALPRIGAQLDDASQVGKLVSELLREGDARLTSIDEVRDECWEHRGQSAQLMADYLIAKQLELAGAKTGEDQAS